MPRATEHRSDQDQTPQHTAGLSRLELGPNVTLGAKKTKTKMKKT